MQTIRVGIDYDVASYGTGGIARYTKALVEGLMQRENLEVVLIVKEQNSIPAGNNVTYYCHGMSRLRFRLCLIAWHILSIRCFRNWPILDVFHGTDFAFPPVGAGADQVVVNIHDVIPLKWPDEVSWRHWLHFRVFCQLVRKTKVPVIVPSMAVASDVTEMLDVPISRVHVVHYGVCI